MQESKVGGYQFIPSTNRAAFHFAPDPTKQGYEVSFDIRVADSAADLNFIWLPISQYDIWHEWFRKRIENPNQIIPRPSLSVVREYRHPYFLETFPLGKQEYVLVLDNTYSQFRGKTVQFHITLRWDTAKPMKGLPIANSEVIELPKDISNVILKANECYISSHYEQCSVMFRKAIDFAIRLKLLQSGLEEKDLFDEQGNELTLSHKIRILRKNNLITQITAKHLDDIKWYGDLAAHSHTKLVVEDIRDNVEPKVRAFLTGLNLKQ